MGITLDLLTYTFLSWPIWLWLSFVAVVVALLSFDLGVLHRKAHVVGVGESLWMSAMYIGVGLAFAGVIYWIYLQSAPSDGLDPRLMIGDAEARAGLAAQLYLTGFLVEKTLALDNVFVISLIFAYFAVPPQYQHRVLFWGIIGVIVLRAIMIGLGAALVSQFSWILYVFAAFLIWTGFAMLRKDHSPDLSNSKLLRFIRKRMRVTDTIEGERFFVTRPDPASGKPVRWATPLFLALIFVEVADLVFAVDSVPAIFAITSDPFIVYTSNIFAILGLRALYFALAAMIHRFKYLKYALAATLVFIGSKIFLGEFFPGGKFPAEWSLSITIGLIASGVLYSLWRTRNPIAGEGADPPAGKPAA
jgi:tellurite resistance protein TerC